MGIWIHLREYALARTNADEPLAHGNAARLMETRQHQRRHRKRIRALATENQKLNQERAQLLARNVAVKSKVEAMIVRLKALEQE